MRTMRYVRATVLAVACAFTSAEAQDQVVVFQHGFHSSSATWGGVPSALRQLYKLQDVRTNTSPCQAYTTQTNQLPAQLPASYGDTLAFVGHSNGGVIARNFSRLHGRTNRIATIGSPHLGAPLATNVLNGNVWSFGRYIWQTIGSVMSYYNFYDGAQSTPFGFNDTYAPALWWLGSNMQPLFASQGWGLDPLVHQFCPIVFDMQPSARILTDTLNATSNLAREGAALRTRVSIVADKSPINGLFHMLWSGNTPLRNAWINARWGFYAGAIASYLAYSRSPDPMLRRRSPDFLTLAALMIDLDFWYAKLNGSLISYQRAGTFPFVPSYTLVAPGDLVVPLWSQHLPLFTREYAVQGYSHMQETQGAQVVGQLQMSLGQDFLIPVRPVGSVASIDVQPPTLTLSQSASATLSATTRDIYGFVVTGKPIAWVSTAPLTATVSSTGVVTAQSASGVALVIASSGGYADTTTVTAVSSAPFISVAISGSAVQIPGIEGVFKAVPNGGSAPITYVWKVNGITRGSGPTFSWAATSSYALNLVATDGRNTTRSVTMNVAMSNCGGGC